MQEIQQLTQEQKELVVNNVAYARKMARKFFRERYRGDLDLEDFEGAGFLGLCDAAKRFDPLRGQNFQTFAHLRIKGAMLDMLRAIGSLPRRRSSREERSSQNGEETVMTFSDSSSRNLASLLVATPYLNIQMFPGDEGDEPQLSYRDSRNPEEYLLVLDNRKEVRRLLEALKGKERSVLEQFYFQSLPFTEMQEAKNGFTKSWLCRIHQNGLCRLRKSIPQGSPLRFAANEL